MRGFMQVVVAKTFLPIMSNPKSPFSSKLERRVASIAYNEQMQSPNHPSQLLPEQPTILT